jgi:hypothetical protein
MPARESVRRQCRERAIDFPKIIFRHEFRAEQNFGCAQLTPSIEKHPSLMTAEASRGRLEMTESRGRGVPANKYSQRSPSVQRWPPIPITSPVLAAAGVATNFDHASINLRRLLNESPLS